jgi:hypothetical protein
LTQALRYDSFILKHNFFDVKAHFAYLVTLRFVQKIYAFESNKQTKAGDGLSGKVGFSCGKGEWNDRKNTDERRDHKNLHGKGH